MNPGNSAFSVMLGIRRDNPCRRIEMQFCMVAVLQEIALRFEFHQNQLSDGKIDGKLPNQWEMAHFNPHSWETSVSFF